MLYFKDWTLTSITGNTSLHRAAEEGDLPALQSLLAKHVDPGMKNKQGQTPLHSAAKKGHVEIVKELLANPNVRADSVDEDGRTPLSHAVENGHFEIVKALLDSGRVNPDLADKNGRTLLSHAAEKGRFDLIDLLLKAGAHPNLPDNHGLIPIHYAAMKGHRNATATLLSNEQALPNQQGKDGKAALHHAVENQHIEVIKLLLENKEVDIKEVDINLADQKGNTPLHYAVNKKHPGIAQLLLEKSDRIKPNLQNTEGLTPLALAAQKNIVSVLKILLENKEVDINRADPKENTPLHYAVENNHRDAADLLLGQRGRIMPNLRNAEGLTPFALAAQKNITPVLTDLLGHEDVDVNKPNHKGETPFFLSAKNYTIHPSELTDACFYRLLGRNRQLFDFGREKFEKVRIAYLQPRHDGMTPFRYLIDAVRNDTRSNSYDDPSLSTRTAMNFLCGMIANEHIRKDIPDAELELALSAIKEKSYEFYRVTLYQSGLDA